MPTATASISWLGALGWLAAIAAAGFLAAWGHILLHTALALRGTEMPPYATGGVHIVPLGQQRPAAKTAAFVEQR